MLAVAIAAAASAGPSAAWAQHASDNAVTAADDAYGLTLGLESVGLYNPGLVRGFNPQVAGNVEVDGLYFDQQGGLSERVVEGSAIKVGVSEIGYAFPAPTGIVDYDLRHPGGDTPSATVIASAGPYQAWGVSLDGSLPLAGKDLVLPIGVSTGTGAQTPFGPYPGYTARASSAGATPVWSPNDRLTVRAILDWQQSTAAKTFPVFFTATDVLPPAVSRGYFGQNWAQGRSTTTNLGGLVSAQLSDVWQLKAGIFRSTNDDPVSFADLYTDLQPNGRAEHLVVGYPDQYTASTSGEARLTGGFTTGDWRHQVIVNVRGRDTDARYGGGDLVDLGPVVTSVLVQSPEPAFVYSARTNDHADLWSVGAAYRLDWSRRGVFEVGVQDENYRETAITPGGAPGTPDSAVSAHPLRVYSNAAVSPWRPLTLYAGYTQGLENSGTAPTSASNSGAVLPASLTWQVDAGARYAVTPKLKLIAGVFELQKPYFNIDANNVDRALGLQQAKGLELSIAGNLTSNLDINVGVLAGKVAITGPNLAAEKVGPVAVGQPALTYVANANYVLPRWPAASVDVSVTYFDKAPGVVDDGVYTPQVTLVNLGGRYQFTAFGRNSSLRLQVQNLFDSHVWTTQYTPGFVQFPSPRTLFAYITTDFP